MSTSIIPCYLLPPLFIKFPLFPKILSDKWPHADPFFFIIFFFFSHVTNMGGSPLIIITTFKSWSRKLDFHHHSPSSNYNRPIKLTNFNLWLLKLKIASWSIIFDRQNIMIIMENKSTQILGATLHTIIDRIVHTLIKFPSKLLY